MRAVVVDRWIEPEDLRVGDAPEPVATPGSVVVEVRAAACNFFDVLQIAGKYQVRPPFPFVPGAEIAGEVREVGAGVSGLAPGDRVMGGGVMTGGYAERVAVDARLLAKVPDGASFEEAAAFPIASKTAYGALVFRARLAAGETVLITAAAGGVGLVAIQLARALGARVVAAARGAAKLEAARAAGADVVVDYDAPEWHREVLEATAGRGVDVVVELVGGAVFESALRCLAWSGRLVVVGFASGQIPEVKLNRVLLKNIEVSGLFVNTYLEHDPARFDAMGAALGALLAERRVVPHVSAVHRLEELPQALRALASRATIGKIVVRP